MSMLMFGVVVFLGLMFLSGTVVVVLAKLTENLIVAMLIVAIFYLLLAVALYVGSVHRTLRRWQRRLDTVYDVSATFEVLYRRAVVCIQKILGSI